MNYAELVRAGKVETLRGRAKLVIGGFLVLNHFEKNQLVDALKEVGEDKLANILNAL